VAFLLTLSACTKPGSQLVITSSPTPTVTPGPTLTPTPEPLGSANHPLVIGAVIEELPSSGDQPQQQLVDSLESLTQFHFVFQQYDTWENLLNDLQTGLVHITWLPPLTYLHAHDLGIARVAMLTNHFGVYYYGVQFLANIESGFVAYYDPASNQTTGNADVALAQFQDRRPCWIDTKSLAGYIYPAALLAENNVIVKEPAFVVSSPATIRALYIKEICDFAVTFAISGDPRTSPSILDDLPDAMDRVIVIWKSDGVIPNLNLSYASLLDNDTVQALNNGFLDLIKADEGKALLTSILDYDIQDMRVVDDSIYDPLRNTLQFLDLDYSTIPGR